MFKWVSVKDKLPEKDDKYLVAIKSSWGSKSYYHSLLYFTSCLEKVDEYEFKGNKKSGFYDYDSEYGYCKVDDVTHWMPLPKLPEE